MNIKLSTSLILVSLCFLMAGILGMAIWVDTGHLIKNISALAVNNRTINAYFAAILTAMALIITLTSNLYSPKLAKLFVGHKFTVFGVAYILLTNFFIVVSHILTPEHPWFNPMAFMCFTLTIGAMFGMIPFLYLVSHFVKPSYFIKLLRNKAIKNINNLHSSKIDSKAKKLEAESLFETIDVIHNMASTAIQRRDKSVLGIVISEIFTILNTLVKEKNNLENNHYWRQKFHFFSHGMSEEAKYHLRKDKLWPEAYILSKVLEDALVLTKFDNEMVPLICRELTYSNDLSLNYDDQRNVQLNMMILNSILKESLENKNEQKFSSVLYYYRMNIELFIGHQKLCNDTINDFIYYGREALRRDHRFAVKNFLFDLGRVINYIAFESEDLSVRLYNQQVKEIWEEFMCTTDELQLYAKQSIIKAFWNLYSQNYNKMTNLIRNDFLHSSLEHAEILQEMIKKKNPLDKEFSDTLICPEYLSGMALTLARDFLSDFKDVINTKAS